MAESAPPTTRGRPARLLRNGVLWAFVAVLVVFALHFEPVPVDRGPAWLGPNISLEGYPLLLVGDSLAWVSPWPSDKIAIPGKDAEELAYLFEQNIGDRRYQQIVLWPGTSHIQDAKPIWRYVSGVRRMVRTAREHADSVLVLGPMPYGPERFALLLYKHNLREEETDILHDTRAPVAEALDLLRRELPADVPVFDVAAVERAYPPEHMPLLFADGIHLTEAGWAVLRRELAAAGTPVIEPGPWMQARYDARMALHTSRERLRALIRDGVRPLARLAGIDLPETPQPQAAPPVGDIFAGREATPERDG